MGRRVSWISCLASSTRRSGRRRRRGAQVLAELSPQLARADAGPGGQRVQVAVVQRAQLDQLQRARHAGGQPRRGAGGGRDFRAAAQAGMEAGLPRPRPWRRRRHCATGRARRTDRTAVDARGLDRGEEASVVAGVAHADGAVAGVVIEIHAAMLTPVRDGVLAVSDRVVRPTLMSENREQESGADPIFCCECLSWPRSRRLSPAIRSLFLSAMEVRAMSAHLFSKNA